MSVLAVLKEIAGETTVPETSCVARVAKDKAPASSLTLDDIVSIFFTEDERRGWLVLEIKRLEKLPTGPITIGPGQRIIDVSKFTEITISPSLWKVRIE